jgi:hypothetical protein
MTAQNVSPAMALRLDATKARHRQKMAEALAKVARHDASRGDRTQHPLPIAGHHRRIDSTEGSLAGSSFFVTEGPILSGTQSQDE